MSKILLKLLFLLLLPFIALAGDITISQVIIRPALLDNYPTSIYFSAENNSDEIDYIRSVELVDYPSIKTEMNKSILEKNVTRVIKLDKLALPPQVKIDTFPLHIFVTAQGLPAGIESLRLRFILETGHSITVAYSL